MGKVIPLVRQQQVPEAPRPLADVPSLGELALEGEELEWLARHAADIASNRPLTEDDFRALVRAVSLDRAVKHLVMVSNTDGDLAVAVERRRVEILGTLGL